MQMGFYSENVAFFTDKTEKFKELQDQSQNFD